MLPKSQTLGSDHVAGVPVKVNVPEAAQIPSSKQVPTAAARMSAERLKRRSIEPGRAPICFTPVSIRIDRSQEIGATAFSPSDRDVPPTHDRTSENCICARYRAQQKTGIRNADGGAPGQKLSLG